MSEKIIYCNVQKSLMYEDYFDLELNDGRMFRWKNFGQVITVDDQDLRKSPISVSGAVIDKARFKELEVLKDFEWFINSNVFYKDEPDTITLSLPHDTIFISINHEYETRLEEYPERDYFDWINDYKFYNQFKDRLQFDDDKAIKYLNNWRRPKLKTNGVLPAVVYHNGDAVYVGMLDSEDKKSVIDAFFRKIYFLQFVNGE